MKIWILSSETPHYWAGGIARYVDNFAKLAGAAGNDVKVISRGEKNKRSTISSGYELIEFPHRFEEAQKPGDSVEPDDHPGWPYNNMAYFSALAYQYAEEVANLIEKEERPDVIECQDYAAVGYFLMQRKLVQPGFLEGIPVLVHLHTPDFAVQLLNQYPRYKLPDYWIGRMEKAALWMADALLSPSKFLAGEIGKHVEGPLPGIKVIPYPWPELDKLSGSSPGDENRIVYPGRIELRKGVEPLIATCEELWRSGSDFVLEMIGGDVHTPLKGGSLTEFLKKRYAHRVESGNLVFHGALPHDECLEKMRTATAVAIPSLWENFPNTCIEAMSLGKVVIASTSGGQAEMIGEDETAGLLFDHSIGDSLKKAITQALAMSVEDRSQMGARARKRIETMCAPDNVLPERLAHYKEVIENYHPKETFPFPNKVLREGVVAGKLTEKPLVSVIVPFYNLGKYLTECIESIYTSKGVQFEILVINDGSNDPHSLRVLESLREEDRPGLRILDIANGGLANARNTGAHHALGELIAFVDADDKIGPDFLKRASGVLQKYPNVHLAYSWVRFFDEGRGVWHSWNFDLPYLLCHNQLIPIVVVRRESFLRYGQNKSHIVYGLEDYEGWISMAEAGCGGVSIPEPLVQYRIRGDSMFKVIEGDKKLYLYDLISAEHPDLFSRYGTELFNLENANGPAYGWDQPTMFKAPQDRLHWHLSRAEEKVRKLEEENEKLRNAEAWHKKERERLFNPE